MSDKEDPNAGLDSLMDGKDRNFRVESDGRGEGDVDMFPKGNIEVHCADCQSANLQVDELECLLLSADDLLKCLTNHVHSWFDDESKAIATLRNAINAVKALKYDSEKGSNG